MKKAISLLLSAALALGMLTGCGQTPSSVPQSGSAAAPGSETATEPVTIKIWHDGDEAIMEQYQCFDDVNDGYWAAEYIKDAAIHGWVEGYGDGTFRADDPIDRAEVVTIVNRLLGREADEDYIADNHRRLVMFPDVSSRHWAYYNVLEAANAHTANLTNPETWEK